MGDNPENPSAEPVEEPATTDAEQTDDIAEPTVTAPVVEQTEEAVSQEAVDQEAVSQESVEQDAVSQESVEQEAVSQESVEQDAAQEQVEEAEGEIRVYAGGDETNVEETIQPEENQPDTKGEGDSAAEETVPTQEAQTEQVTEAVAETDKATEADQIVAVTAQTETNDTQTDQQESPRNEVVSPRINEINPLSPDHSAFYLNVQINHDENADINGAPKVVQVEVMSNDVKKPFLGGFRHRLSGIEYHNASSQTYPKKILPTGIEKNERDTQTVITRNQVQQTASATSTQMTKIGCYVSNVPDRVVIPGKYFTAAEKEALILEKVIILQSYWRRWLSTQYVHRLRRDRDLRQEWERVQTEQKEEERAARIRKEFERRMKPKTKEDFDLLYAALEKWRREEMERIDERKSGPEKKAALCGLLEQEEYLIQSIERHRINANQTNVKERDRAFLEKAAAPKKWRAYDGKMTEMDTPHSLRAQQLRDLYKSLEMEYLTQDERLDVLLTLKYTIKEHECKLTQELMELIDREADLLTRGIKVSNLEGLRQRILALFLQYAKTPLFNPEAARLLKVPADPSSLRKDIYFCPSCNSYLPSSSFPIASNSRIVGRCKKCAKIDNDARLRCDFTKIRAMMTNLRRTEEGYNDGSRIAFTIQYADLQYLVENIWNSQSALSGEMDIAELALVRWNRHEHWSPWNCVLFTKEEADAHMRLDNVSEAYGRIFVGKCHHKHVLAKNYFSKLIKLSDSLQNDDDNMRGKVPVQPSQA